MLETIEAKPVVKNMPLVVNASDDENQGTRQKHDPKLPNHKV